MFIISKGREGGRGGKREGWQPGRQTHSLIRESWVIAYAQNIGAKLERGRKGVLPCSQADSDLSPPLAKGKPE